jgi:hypothetical protein
MSLLQILLLHINWLWVAEQLKISITGIDLAGKSVSGRWEYKPERQHSPEWAAFWNMVDKGKE